MAKIVSMMAFLLFSGVTLSIAQVYQSTEWYNLDSLETILPGQQGIEKINTLYRISASLCFEDFHKSLQYANEALDLSEKAGYKEGVAAATKFKGHAYYYNGEFPKALDLLWKSMNMYEKLGDDYHVARVMLEIGTINLAAMNNEKARELLFIALQRFRKEKEDGSQLGSVTDTLLIYSIIGRTLRITGKSDSALKVYKTYVDIGRKNNFELTNLMVHEGFISICFSNLKEYDSAIFYYRRALNYPEINQSIKILKNEYKRRMAMVYLGLGRIDSAFYYLSEAYESLSKEGYLMQSQLASMQLGELYLSMREIPKANFYFQRSEELMEEQLMRASFYRFDSLKYTVSFGWEVLAPISKKFMEEYIYNSAVNFYKKMYQYYKTTDNQGAYVKYLEKYTETKDTLNKLERRRETIEVQTKYETERKEEDIIRLSQENELKDYQIKQSRIFLFGLGGFLLLGIGFVVLFIRQSKLKEEQERTKLQQQLFRSQMNPHFIFNSLGSIQSSIINEEPDKAVKYLSRFSKLMRNILDSSQEETILLSEERSTIENYLELQKIRFPKKFDYSIEMDENIDTENISIPPMLAQPFIENAIEHGIKLKETKGNICVSFKLNGNKILYEVEDDGIGRQKSQEILQKQNRDHKSLATTMTQERIKVLNKKLKQKITLEIRDLKDNTGAGTGTKVVFEIPILS